MVDKSILSFSTCIGIQRTQHFSESRALTESEPLNKWCSLTQCGFPAALGTHPQKSCSWILSPRKSRNSRKPRLSSVLLKTSSSVVFKRKEVIRSKSSTKNRQSFLYTVQTALRTCTNKLINIRQPSILSIWGVCIFQRIQQILWWPLS